MHKRKVVGFLVFILLYFHLNIHRKHDGNEENNQLSFPSRLFIKRNYNKYLNLLLSRPLTENGNKVKW